MQSTHSYAVARDVCRLIGHEVTVQVRVFEGRWYAHVSCRFCKGALNGR